jgi:uncharacterized RDD family membrane protein YckC
MQWYFAESGRQVGPVDEDVFNSYVASGRVAPNTLVWSSGMPNWQPFNSLNSIAAPVVPPLPVDPHMRFCSECGRAFSIDDLAAFGDSLVCAECKPIYTQKLREGVLTHQLHRFGGFWIRFVAVLIDGLILAVVSMFYTPFITLAGFDPHDPTRFFIAFGILLSIQFLIRMVYETVFTGRFGATPGKMVCHLRVIRPDGRPLTYLRSWCRFLAKEVNTFTLLIGYIIAAFDDEKRTLHDRICDTRVVRS